MYLDFLGCAGTLALGHNHPVQKDAIRAHLDLDLPTQTLDMATVIKDEFLEELYSTLPEEMQGYRVQFCGGSGTDAVDAAIKLCKVATGSSNVLSFHGAYHGQGHGPLALMGNLECKAQPGGLMPGVQVLPFPNSYRQPFGLSAGAEGDRAVVHYIEHLLRDVESGVLQPVCVAVHCTVLPPRLLAVVSID